MSLKTNASFIQNYKVTRSESASTFAAELWPAPNVPTQASVCYSEEEEEGEEEESWTLFSAAKAAANYCSERRNTFPSAGSHFCFPSTELRHTVTSRQWQPGASCRTQSYWNCSYRDFHQNLAGQTSKSFPFQPNGSFSFLALIN